MTERKELSRIDWYRLLPWLHIFRSFGIAIDPRKVFLASIAVLLVSLGSGLLHWAIEPGSSADAAGGQSTFRGWPWDLSANSGLVKIVIDQRRSTRSDSGSGSNAGNNSNSNSIGTSGIEKSGDSPVGDVPRAIATDTSRPAALELLTQHARQVTELLASPFLAVLEPAARVFSPNATATTLLRDLSMLLTSLIVWTVFGGAISRLAAMQFARDQQVGLRGGLTYSLQRIHEYLTAPLIPVAGLLGVSVLAAAFGALGLIPGVGMLVVAIGWGVAIVFGAVTMAILLGLALGWPIMFATISVEGSDGFDGLSRAYNYVYERTWHLLWYVLVAAVHGVVMTTILWFSAQVVLYLAAWGVAWGCGTSSVAGLVDGFPAPLGLQVFYRLASTDDSGPSLEGPRVIMAIWTNACLLMLHGFVHSFFWTAATVIYFLLRAEVDGNELDEVYVSDRSEDDELLPLVGIAAIQSAQARQAAESRQTVPTRTPGSLQEPTDAIVSPTLTPPATAGNAGTTESAPPADLTP